MKTSEKLLKAFHSFRPHISGHKTAMDLFFEALREVEKMENMKLATHNANNQQKFDGK